MASTKRTTSAFASTFPDDDGFDGMWPETTFASTSGNNAVDPWTASNAVAEAWPEYVSRSREKPKRPSSTRRTKTEWTPIEGAGFPDDPFTSNYVWPSPHASVAKVNSQRMSDEDWLPTVSQQNPTNASAAWGSVARGRSEESDEWYSDPLSKSQDGFGEPVLGSASRPIALDDLDVPGDGSAGRASGLLHQADQERNLRLSAQASPESPPCPVSSPKDIGDQYFRGSTSREDIAEFVNEDPALDHFLDDDSSLDKEQEEKKDEEDIVVQSRIGRSKGRSGIGMSVPSPPPPPPPPPRSSNLSANSRQSRTMNQRRQSSRSPPLGSQPTNATPILESTMKSNDDEGQQSSLPSRRIDTTVSKKNPWGEVNLRKVDSPVKKDNRSKTFNQSTTLTPTMAARLKERQDRKRNVRRTVNDPDTSEAEDSNEPGPIRIEKVVTATNRPSLKSQSSVAPPVPRVAPSAPLAIRQRQAKIMQQQRQREQTPLQPAEQVGKDLGPSNSFISFNKDIESLRAIRRQSVTRSTDVSLIKDASVQYSTPTYNENDPMQRSLLRLLSKQVLIIQCAARRFLAVRKTYSRMWAVIEIQACARRFIQQQRYLTMHYAACLIQSVYRGGRVRDQILLEHCCAVEIQRWVRGYLATLQVYEEIYQITLVQSVVRRRQAIDKATDRMVFIIQVQSLVRGFLARKRMRGFDEAAKVIQKTWRGSLQRLCYELDLLDIVIVQSVARRYLVSKEIKRRAALKIQKTWRCYSCFLSYQIKLFGSITIQSLWRGHVSRKYYTRLLESRRHVAATMIQAQWRSYDASMNYLHYLADVLTVQGFIRTWIRRKHASKAIQSAARVFLVKLGMRKASAAATIQAAWRDYLNRQALSRLKAACIIQREWKDFSKMNKIRKAASAVVIQKHWRGFLAYADFMFVLADIILIQSLARRFLATQRRRRLVQEIEDRAANKIQSLVHSRYLKKVAAAVLIQVQWRSFITETKDFIERFENQAATTIQSAWRCYSCFSKYVVVLDSAITMQCAFRAYSAYHSYTAKLWASTMIQDVYRKRLSVHEEPNKETLKRVTCEAGSIAEKESSAVVQIQKLLRGGYTRRAYLLYVSARKVQAVARAWRVRKAYILYIAARKIQAAARGRRTYRAYKVYCACRLIQSNWRGSTVKKAYRQYCAARCIQANFRSIREREKFRQTKEKLKTYCAVLLIQACIRRKLARLSFISRREKEMAGEIEAACVIQKNWRGFRVRNKGYRFVKWLSVWQRRHRAAVKIQSSWRGFSMAEKYWNTLGSVILIQSFARRSIQELKYNEIYGSILVVQSFGRVILAKQELERRRFILSLVRTIQGKDPLPTRRTSQKFAGSGPSEQSGAANWEMVLAEQRRLNNAARVIQRFFAMVKKEVDLAIAQKEKKRRKRKKKKKQHHRPTNDEDYFLEKVWGNTFEDPSSRPGGSDRRSQKPKIPREYTKNARNLGSKSLDDDARSHISTSSVNRVPKSRMGLPTRIIDEDYALETAWMDAEIKVAKRRMRGMPNRMDP